MDDHPLFAAYAPRTPNTTSAELGQSSREQPASQPSEHARGKQPAADDPPVVDPSTVQPEAAQPTPPGGFPDFGSDFRGGRCGGRRGFGSFGGRGGPYAAGPFGGMNFGPPPFWGGPRHHSRPYGHRHGPPHHGPHHHEPGRHPGHEGRRGPPERGEAGFNLGDFLNNLGDKIGVDLSGAAENLGLDKYSAPRTGEDVDFEPRTDIFDTANQYIVHLSLPGAKKQDVGVDWDGEHSVLRITGVVHRPEVDEEMLARLVVNGRKRENGVFEKAIRLGTKRDPASVDVAGITAKMIDGVLVVKVPKTEREVHKREVPISGSTTPSPDEKEKELHFDADEEMYDAEPRQEATTLLTSPAATENTAENKAKEDEAREDRSITAGRDEEQLPAYADEDASDKISDWEKDSDEEADYVKINVD
jgi:HSP20 family protein